MEKKLITEMKFMMERLENPRMTYTEYEKKRNQLIKEGGSHPYNFILNIINKYRDGKVNGKSLTFDDRKDTIKIDDGHETTTLDNVSKYSEEEIKAELGKYLKLDWRLTAGPELFNNFNGFRDFIKTLLEKVNNDIKFNLKELEVLFNDSTTRKIYSPGWKVTDKKPILDFDGVKYEMQDKGHLEEINELPSWAKNLESGNQDDYMNEAPLNAHIKNFFSKDKPKNKKRLIINEQCLVVTKESIITGNVFNVTIGANPSCKSPLKGTYILNMDNKKVETKDGPEMTFDELVDSLNKIKVWREGTYDTGNPDDEGRYQPAYDYLKYLGPRLTGEDGIS